MIIGISGMIGCGKSTLANNLKKHYPKSFVLEEFSEDDDVFNTFLRWCYEQKPNIDFGFQSYIIESLSDSFNKAIKKYNKLNLNWYKHHIFLDRFNLEHYIFAQILLEKKPAKYQKAFDALFYSLIDEKENPDLAIYIDINFETFKERIFSRKRASEIDNYQKNEAYFRKLHHLYKELYLKLVKKFKIPYIIIQSDFLNDKEVLHKAVESIDRFVKEYQNRNENKG